MAGTPLRVATFNIHGGKPANGPGDLKAIAVAIQGLQADFVGLQEVYRLTPHPSYSDDQPGRLRRLLDMHVSFLPSLGLGPLGYGNAIVSRQAPVKLERVRLPGGREPRALLDATFETPHGPFHFLCTHLSLRAEERVAEVRALARHLVSVPAPLVLAADLNGGAGGPELAALRALGLADCSAPDLLTFPSARPTLKLDYLLTSPDFEIREVRTVDAPASDHRPLVVDLLWRHG